MIISLAQLTFLPGQIETNKEKVILAIHDASVEGADLVLFPECALSGITAGDNLDRSAFVKACREAIEEIALQCKGITAVVGAPNYDEEEGVLFNSLYFLQNGEVAGGANKSILNDWDILSESRWFVGDDENTPLSIGSHRIRVLFDEYDSPLIEKEDEIVVFAGAASFTTESYAYRRRVFSEIAAKNHKPVIAVNHIGGFTGVLYDGNSMVFNAQGKLTHRLAEFEEDAETFDTTKESTMPVAEEPEWTKAENARIECIHRGLVFGIRTYFETHRFTDATLGLSGGLDSAIVATLAVEALGHEHVTGLLMPSHFSTDHSVGDAEALAANLDIATWTLPIAPIYEAALSSLQPIFLDKPFDVTEENLQARIRALLLMASSNKHHRILLNTSNKSEAAVGYGTLYGDLCGSLCVIADVYKTDLYLLARHLNRERELIPVHTIEKAPSAELHPGQVDQDSLPDYTILDRILHAYIEENLDVETIISTCKEDRARVEKIISMVKACEFKRAQVGPVIRVSSRCFGHGAWQFPF